MHAIGLFDSHESSANDDEQRLYTRARAAEGRKVARLHRRFSPVLQQALRQRTRQHLYRQAVVSMEAA